MKSLKELGLKHLKSTFSKDHMEFRVPAHIVYKKENIFMETLQVLIDDCLEDEAFYKRRGYELQALLLEHGEDGVQEYKSFMRKVKAIEKATGRSWEEIKQILIGE